MGEGPWLAGSVLSLADLHAAPMLQSFAWRRRPNNFLAGRIASSEVGPRERASELCADPSAAAPRVTALIVGAVLRIRCSDAATAGRERKPKSRYGEMSSPHRLYHLGRSSALQPVPCDDPRPEIILVQILREARGELGFLFGEAGCSWARMRSASERAMDNPPDIVSLASRLGQGCSGSEAMTDDDLPDRFARPPRASRVVHQRAASGSRGKPAC